MNPVFTEYVRGLAPSGEPPDRQSFAKVWEELRRLLERELRRRGLWNAPPSYLGIYGRSGWREDVAPAFGPGTEDALEELVAELYAYVFVDRLNKLVDQLRIKPDIDGLVVLNVRHLLHERQKKHDRLGYRVFEVFHQAVVRSVAMQELFVLRGDARIRNDTVLGYRPGLDPDCLPPVPQETVGEWNDFLMPELVVGKGSTREWVIESLRKLLGRLPRTGTEAFIFRELLDPFKKDARVRWAARFELARNETGVSEAAGEPGKANAVPLVGPDLEVEDRESLEKLDECLATSFDRLTPDRNREDLRALWRDLHRRAHEGEIPSQRKLSEELNLPRRRLSKLFTTLGELIDDCQRAFSKATMTEIGPPGAEGGAMRLNSRAEALRAQTGQARRRHAALQADRSRRSRQKPRPGDVFFVNGAGDLPVEWVLLREDAEGFHAVPADVSPLVGPSDVIVPKEVDGGPLTLRCALGVHLDAADLDPEMRTASLPAETLEQALALASSVAQPIEDPELGEWIREFVEPAREAVRRREDEPAFVHPRQDRSDRRPRASRRRIATSSYAGNPYALAASVLLVVGLGSGLMWQRWEIARLQAPGAVGNVPFESIVFSVDERRTALGKLVLPADARELLLILNVVELMDEPFEQYRLRLLVKATQEEVWRSEELREMKGANLTVKLPVRLIPRGDYLFRLHGVDGDREESLAEYALHIEYEP